MREYKERSEMESKQFSSLLLQVVDSTMEIQKYTTPVAVLFLLYLITAVSLVEAGGYSASLEAARLVAEGKITVEDNVSAPINNSRLGIPYRTGYHFQPKGYWINGMWANPPFLLCSPS